jgi:hypothetical protein
VTINWLALLQVTVVTIVGATAVVGLMSLANWLLGTAPGEPDEPGEDAGHGHVAARTRLHRVAGYATIGVVAAIIAGGLYLIVHQHVARLLGLD